MRHSLKRGFTLVELLVYVGLVSAGVLLIGSVEMYAQRSLKLQQRLIEVEVQTVQLGGTLRRDVEEARGLQLEGEHLLITTLAGERVRFRGGERAVLDPAGEVTQVQESPDVSACAFTLERLPSGRMRVTATFSFEFQIDSSGSQTRARTRTALTRLVVPQ